MKIYVFKDDLRSYSYSPIDGVEAIEVEVSDDFQGGGKMYNPETGVWTDDAPVPRDFVDEAEAYRSMLLEQANAFISGNQWPSMQVYGMLSDEEESKFKEWLVWMKQIKTVDTAEAPDVIWPDKPDT